ncbi:MAG: hypothetical protein AMXMBFR61_09280 [Fimbriimonadales bacterium]
MTPRHVATLWSEWVRSAEALLQVLACQERALISRDTDQVQDCLEQVESARIALQAKDEEARSAISALAEAVGSEPTLREVARRLPPSDARLLSSLAGTAERLADALRASFIRNHALIQNELAYVSGTLMLIGQALREPSTPYGKAVAGALTLDRKV